MENKRQGIWPLAAAAVWIAACVLATLSGGRMERAPDYDVKLDAAQRLEACMARVREYKVELGIPISEEDIHRTGMLGDRFTGITTTLGAVEAKRTSANSDMAALAVQLLTEAGVRAGDTVGAGFSGSFPALDLAVLCACDAMGVRCVYIASVGASTYGANQPALTLPDMVCRLKEDGLISAYPAAVTPGGAKDCGADMDQRTLEGILSRVALYGVPVWRESELGANLDRRMAVYAGEGPISCFVGVGGNLTTAGRDGLDLGQGVLRLRNVRVTEDSGLLQRYGAQGLPVVYLLNLRALTADYGLPYDPETLGEPGESAVYYARRYDVLPAAAGLAGGTALVLYYAAQRKRSVHTGGGQAGEDREA